MSKWPPTIPPPDSIDARGWPLKELDLDDPNDKAFNLVRRVVNFVHYFFIFFSAAHPSSNQ
jgi:hypothetical protein